jgi:hypothetical protein
MSEINNLFDFIDFLEKQDRQSGTANQNRAFIYNTISAGADATDNPLDLLSAYQAVGISVPESVFSNILDVVSLNGANANMVRIFAPTSKIPTNDLPVFDGNMEEDYIAYSTSDITDIITGERTTHGTYLRFTRDMTLADATKALAAYLLEKYKWRVNSLQYLRIYVSENALE